MANLLAFVPAVPDWGIGSAVVAQKDPSLGIGYYVQQRVGDAPGAPVNDFDVYAKLYYKDCFTPVNPSVQQEPAIISNEVFSPSNDTFTYEIDFVPSLINNSSMTTFENDGFSGQTIGNIEFCSIVLNKLSGTDVGYRKTRFGLKFNLTDNTFALDDGDGIGIALPTITYNVQPSIAVHNVVNNTAPSSLLTMANIVSNSVTNVLSGLTLPPNMQVVVQHNTINGIDTESLGSGRRLQSPLMTLNVNLHVNVTFECFTDEHCDNQNNAAAAVISTIQNLMINALVTGDIDSEIQTLAQLEQVGYFANAVANHTNGGVHFPTNANGELLFNIGEIQASMPQFFSIYVLDQFTVTACHCDHANFQCYTTPQSLGPNDVLAICLERSADEVFVVNLEMKMEGDNGYVFYPVTYGEDGYLKPHPLFTQIQRFDAARILIVTTNVLAGFSTVNGGASSMTITGNAMLESKIEGFDGRKLQESEDTVGGFELVIDLAPPEEEEVQEPETFCEILQNLLMALF